MSAQTTAEIILRQHKTGVWTWRFGDAVGTGGDMAQGALDGAREYLIERFSVDAAREIAAQVYPWNGQHYTVLDGTDIGTRRTSGGKDAASYMPPTVPPSAPYRIDTFRVVDSTGTLGSWNWQVRYGKNNALSAGAVHDAEGVDSVWG